MVGLIFDYVGYEGIIEFILTHRLLEVEGDMVEVGTFLGGGTYKLSRFLSFLGVDKKIYTIDCYDFGADTTVDRNNIVMGNVYREVLNYYCKDKTQEDVVKEATRLCDNVVVIKDDSLLVNFTTPLCFGFIDGAHDVKHVESDFYLVWNNLSENGVAAVHDYNADIPALTGKVNELWVRHKNKIGGVYLDDSRHILYIQKNRGLDEVDWAAKGNL